MVDAPERTHRRLASTVVAAGLALVLLASACSKQESSGGSGGTVPAIDQIAETNKLEPNDAPKSGGKVVMAVTAETNGWNPALAQWADAGNFVGGTVVEPLLAWDPKGNYVPWLAESAEPRTPGQFDAWRIKLRPNVKFSNGEPLDSAVVKRNLELYASPAALSGIALEGVIKEIRAVDPLTLEVDLSIPWSGYRNNLAGPSGYMMANAMLDSEDQGKSRPIGTGPFVFDTWVPDSSFKVKKNPTYWRKDDAGRQLPYLDEIEFKPIADSQARVQALRSGDVDMLLTTQAADVATLKSEYTVVTDFNGEKTFVMLNEAEDPNKAKNPFKNIHARKALAYATNREALSQSVSPDITLKSSTTPIIAGTKWEIDENQTGYYPYDPAKAKQEIEAYKKDTGESGIKFQFAGLANIEDQKAMQLLQGMWKEVGIESTIDTREQTSYITQLVLGGFQASYFRNYGYVDPDSDWVFWHSSQAKGLGVLSINFQQMKDDQLDAAIDDARRTDDLNRQKQDYLKATQRINDQATNIWLFNTPYSIITQPRIRGMNQARQQGFGNFLPKPWFWTSIWKN